MRDREVEVQNSVLHKGVSHLQCAGGWEQATQVPRERCSRWTELQARTTMYLLIQGQSDKSRELELVLLTSEFPREPAAFSFSVSE